MRGKSKPAEETVPNVVSGGQKPRLPVVSDPTIDDECAVGVGAQILERIDGIAKRCRLYGEHPALLRACRDDDRQSPECRVVEIDAELMAREKRRDGISDLCRVHRP